jgi:hypothetical protein
LKLKIRDLAFKTVGSSQYAEIVVNGKTGTRPIPLINSIPYLKDYLDHEHPMPRNPKAPLICGVGKGLGRHLRYFRMAHIYRTYKQKIFPTFLESPSVSPEDKKRIDLNLDTHVKSLDASEDQKICTDMSDHGSDKSDKSDRVLRYIPGGNGNGRLLRCYYCDKKGSVFETNNESEYHRHGNQKHFNKSMYPNLATMQKYGLIPQGKEWEI